MIKIFMFYPSCKNIFMLYDTHENFVTICYRFSDLERDYAHQENNEYKQLAVFVATMQLLANYTCKSKPKNAVGMYCGSKDQ